MKLFKLTTAILLAAIGYLSLTAAAKAQANLVVTPTELTVAITRSRDAVVTRTLLLQATDTVTNIQVIPTDLVSADNRSLISVTDIQPILATTTVTADTPLSIPIQFDLRGASSAQYKGNLFVQYHGGTQTVPVTVDIKDQPFGPLVVLILGVCTALTVSAYRAQGKPRDELLVRMGQVRTGAQADAQLHASFETRIEGTLVEAESNLQAKKWSDAEEAVKHAEEIWLRWRKDRLDWLEQLAYAQELISSNDLGDLKANDSLYLWAVAQGIRDAVRDAPDMVEGPIKLKERLTVQTDQLSRYLKLQSVVESLNKLPSLTTDQRSELANFQNKLDNSLPDDETGFGNLSKAVAKTRETLLAQAAQATSLESVRGIQFRFPPLPPPVPTLRLVQAEEVSEEDSLVPAGARRRLAWFKWGGYLIAIILLAGIGFGQLYIAQTTFGSNPWSDYLALLIWGFGAEASRASVTAALREMELPI